MAGATSSITFASLALLVISFSVLCLLRHFLPLRTSPLYLLIPIFLALALPISIILLVPIDLASSLKEEDEIARGIWLPTSTVLVAWRITYWLTFVLTWVVLPILGEYLDSGYRTPKARLLYSVRSNGRYQLIVLLCGLAGLMYIGLTNGFGGTSIKALIMALAYCWGLVLAIYLMGHGLVAIPRRLIQDANLGKKLRRIQNEAPMIHDRMTTACSELEELESQVQQLHRRKNGVSQDHQDWIAEIAAESSPEDGHSTAMQASDPLPAIITDRYLAELARKVARARHKQTRFVQEWDHLVQQATETQIIIDSSASQRLTFASSHNISLLTPYTRYVIYTKISPAVRITTAAILALTSIAIVWSELIKSLLPKYTFIALTIYRSPSSPTATKGSVPFTGQLVSCLLLLYMCFAALSSFRSVKIWGNRALVRRYTYGESAAWYSAQVAKLTVPLSYNFITLLPKDVHQHTGFYHVLGRLIDLTPLGKGFDYFFPIFILVPVCATLFNLYGKVKNIFGFGLLGLNEDESEDGASYGGWMEGRGLIAQAQQQQSIIPSSRASHHLTQSPPSTYPPYTDGTTSPINPSQLQSSPSSRPSQASNNRNQPSRLQAATLAAEEEDESVFSGFAHRVRNTLDTMDKPDWMSDLVNKKPKWITGGGGDDNGQRSERYGGGGDAGSSSRGGFLKFFGGSARDGQVRL